LHDDARSQSKNSRSERQMVRGCRALGVNDNQSASLSPDRRHRIGGANRGEIESGLVRKFRPGTRKASTASTSSAQGGGRKRVVLGMGRRRAGIRELLRSFRPDPAARRRNAAPSDFLARST